MGVCKLLTGLVLTKCLLHKFGIGSLSIVDEIYKP